MPPGACAASAGNLRGNPSELVPRRLAARVVGGDSRHEYLLSISDASYLRVSLCQMGVEISARLLAPDGAVAAEAAGPSGWRKEKRLSAALASGGKYRLVAQLAAGAPEAHYRLLVEELRPARASDGERVEAEREVAVARGLLAQGEKPAWREALDRVQKARAIWARMGEVTKQIESLNLVAQASFLLYDLPGSLAAGEQAIGLARQAGDRAGEASALLLRGRAQQNREDSLASYREALRQREELDDGPGRAEVLFLLGVRDANDGRYESALPYLLQSRELREPDDLVGQAKSLGAIATTLGQLGRIERALADFAESLRLGRKAGDDGALAATFDNLASMQVKIGQLQEAQDDYRHAADLYRRLGKEADEAWDLAQLGATEIHLGDRESAREHLIQARSILGKYPTDGGATYALLQLSNLERASGELGSALSQGAEALVLSRRGKQRVIEIASLYALGRTLRALGDPHRAALLLAEAAWLADESKDRGRQVQSMVELGKAYHEEGRWEEASQVLCRVLDSEAATGDVVAEAELETALLERDRGHLEAARVWSVQALEILEAQREDLVNPEQRINFLATKRSAHELYLDVLMRLEEAAPGRAHAVQAFEASERARARGLLDLLLEEKSEAWKEVEPELAWRQAENERGIESIVNRMIEAARRPPRAGDGARLERDLHQARAESGIIALEIRRARRRVEAARRPAPLALSEIQALLDRRTALLEYAVGAHSSYLFVVTDDGHASYRLAVTSGELRRSVARLREILQPKGRGQYATYTGAAYELYRQLLAPAERWLARRPRLLIAPDGPLNSLSFEALLTRPRRAKEKSWNDRLPYLIRDHAVSYVPSASVLARLGVPVAKDPVSRKLLVALADGADAPPCGPGGMPPRPSAERGSSASEMPVANSAPEEGPAMRAFRQSNLDRLPPLLHACGEITAIAGLFAPGESLLLSGPEASKGAVRRSAELSRARWIHFATHGLLNDDPDLSGLLLARRAGPTGGDLLQAREVSQLRLTADLVVLSACRTGLGREILGEGVIGLPRAFLHAGAASVLVSLWTVDDASTPELMVSFYRHLLATGDKSGALRLAKLELLAHPSSAFPYYWAPFILIGKTETIAPEVTTGAPLRQ